MWNSNCLLHFACPPSSLWPHAGLLYESGKRQRNATDAGFMVGIWIWTINIIGFFHDTLEDRCRVTFWERQCSCKHCAIMHCAYKHCAIMHCAYMDCAIMHCAYMHCAVMHCAYMHYAFIHGHMIYKKTTFCSPKKPTVLERTLECSCESQTVTCEWHVSATLQKRGDLPCDRFTPIVLSIGTLFKAFSIFFLWIMPFERVTSVPYWGQQMTWMP